MLSGLLVWAIKDPDQMIELALFAKDNVPQNIATILKMVANFGFNFFFSKLVSLNAVASLGAVMFSEYDQVFYMDHTGGYVQSQLFKLGVWRKNSRKVHPDAP